MHSILAVKAPIRLLSTRHLLLRTYSNVSPFLKRQNPTKFTRSTILSRPSNFAFYSTKTDSPPPPPQPESSTSAVHHDKNAKGKIILGRVTRAFTFSASTLMVIGASGVSLLVLYLILSELFLPSGDTKTFNKAVKLVEKNEQAQKLLGFESGTRLKAHGEVGPDVWVRNRPPQSVKSRGKDGKDRLFMRFVVETEQGKYGTVSLEQVDESFWKASFEYVALDVAGSKRLYIVEPKIQSKNYIPRVGGSQGFLGLKWGPKSVDPKEEK